MCYYLLHTLPSPHRAARLAETLPHLGFGRIAGAEDLDIVARLSRIRTDNLCARTHMGNCCSKDSYSAFGSLAQGNDSRAA
jgi:hypothetical protein